MNFSSKDHLVCFMCATSSSIFVLSYLFVTKTLIGVYWYDGMECDSYFHCIYLLDVMKWTSEWMKIQRESKEIDISFLSPFHSTLHSIPPSFHSIIPSIKGFKVIGSDIFLFNIQTRLTLIIYALYWFYLVSNLNYLLCFYKTQRDKH